MILVWVLILIGCLAVMCWSGGSLLIHLRDRSSRPKAKRLIRPDWSTVVLTVTCLTFGAGFGRYMVDGAGSTPMLIGYVAGALPSIAFTYYLGWRQGRKDTADATVRAFAAIPRTRPRDP